MTWSASTTTTATSKCLGGRAWSMASLRSALPSVTSTRAPLLRFPAVPRFPASSHLKLSHQKPRALPSFTGLSPDSHILSFSSREGKHSLLTPPPKKTLRWMSLYFLSWLNIDLMLAFLYQYRWDFFIWVFSLQLSPIVTPRNLYLRR